MKFGNLMLSVDLKSLDIVGWVTIVIAVLGMCLFFGDLIINIKKHRNTRLNVIGLVFISISLVCFVLMMVFSDMELIFMFIALAFMIGYFVCDVIVAVCIGRQNAREGKGIFFKRKNKQPSKNVVADDEGSELSEPVEEENDEPVESDLSETDEIELSEPVEGDNADSPEAE